VETIKEHNAFAVLGDAVPTLKMAAQYTGVKYISLLNAYMSRYYSDTRSLPSAHPANVLMNKLPGGIQKLFTAQGEAIAFKKIHKPFVKLRTKYNLPQVDNYLDEMEGDQTLICDLPSLFPQKNLPTHYTCCGPLIYDDYQDGSPVLSLDIRKKTIFVSMGSTGDWSSVQFLNDGRYSIYNIITAGDSEGVLNSSHIKKVDFIAASAILPVTDLVICHGGNGTIYQALAYGLPLLCKASHFEQEWNVAALEKKGLTGTLRKTDSEIYEKLIAEWSHKKQHYAHKGVMEAINLYTAQLNGRISAIARSILDMHLVTQHAV